MDGGSGKVTSRDGFGRSEGEDLPLGLAVTDLRDRFVDVNRVFCEIVGRSRDDLLGEPYVGIVHPEDRAREESRIIGLLSRRASTYTADARYLRTDGTTRWVTVRASMAAHDRPVAIRRVLDVTERLRDELERDRLFALSPDVIAVIDFEEKRLRVNPAMTRVLGWTQEDLRSLELADLLHPDDRDAAVAEFYRVLAGEEVVDVQARVRARDGSYRWMSTSLSVLPGQLYYACSRDITPRHVAQEALERSEERFRRLFDASPIALAVSDADLRFLRINRAYCEMVGYTENELIGQSFAMVTHPDDIQAHADLVRRVLAGEIPNYEIEKRYGRADGEVIWGLVRGTGVYETDGSFVHLAMVEDVTEIRRVEADRRKLDALKDVFVRVAAHDLQNPLVTISALAALLARPDPALDVDQQRRVIRSISTHAQRLQHMVSTFLDLDRLYTSSCQPDRRPTDLGALARRMADVVELKERPLVVEVEGVVAEVDPDHIERILENLLVNAATHTPPGTPVWLRITVVGDNVLVAVEDAGAGVPPESRQTVFELFRTGRREGRRAGIGLWVVSRLAALHGGQAWVEERPGGGASFRVLLPK
jgi:PAS domain S-box-containing protein